GQGNGGQGGGGGGGGAPTGPVTDGGAREGTGRGSGSGDGDGDGAPRDDSRLDEESVYDPPRRPGTSGEELRLPGRPGGEGGEIDEGRAPGQGVASTPRVPYRQVLGAYREAAIRAIERDGYPHRLRTTVRDYFDALGRSSSGGRP
ncbi:MAG TPA: hypothetical protein VM324_15725, partial [Egibacteraceae bacterium]|nr:hypothetical protein [Egibacteraceae bacterium]